MYKCIECKQTTVQDGTCVACGTENQDRVPFWLTLMPIVIVLVFIGGIITLFLKVDKITSPNTVYVNDVSGLLSNNMMEANSVIVSSIPLILSSNGACHIQEGFYIYTGTGAAIRSAEKISVQFNSGETTEMHNAVISAEK